MKDLQRLDWKEEFYKLKNNLLWIQIQACGIEYGKRKKYMKICAKKISKCIKELLECFEKRGIK